MSKITTMVTIVSQSNSFHLTPVLCYDVSIVIRNENLQIESDVGCENLESLEYVDLLVQNLVRAGLLAHVNIEYN